MKKSLRPEYFNRLASFNSYDCAPSVVLSAVIGESLQVPFRKLRTPISELHKQHYFDIMNHEGTVSLKELSDALWFHFHASILSKRRIRIPKLGRDMLQTVTLIMMIYPNTPVITTKSKSIKMVKMGRNSGFCRKSMKISRGNEIKKSK